MDDRGCVGENRATKQHTPCVKSAINRPSVGRVRPLPIHHLPPPLLCFVVGQAAVRACLYFGSSCACCVCAVACATPRLRLSLVVVPASHATPTTPCTILLLPPHPIPSHAGAIRQRQAAAAGPQIRQGHPLNLSISLGGGKETNQDPLSNGERSGDKPNLKIRAPRAALEL